MLNPGVVSGVGDARTLVERRARMGVTVMRVRYIFSGERELELVGW